MSTESPSLRLSRFIFDFISALFDALRRCVRCPLGRALGFVRPCLYSLTRPLGRVFGGLFGLMAGIFQILTSRLRVSTSRQPEPENECEQHRNFFHVYTPRPHPLHAVCHVVFH